MNGAQEQKQWIGRRLVDDWGSSREWMVHKKGAMDNEKIGGKMANARGMMQNIMKRQNVKHSTPGNPKGKH